jgi:phosphoenolpyruvate carboxykinase (GTP)
MGHRALEAWVEEAARLTKPLAVHWCDGSEDESARINALLVSTGGFIPLRPVSFGPDLLCDGPFQGWQSLH